MSIAKKLKTLRKKQQLSVVECADFVGVSTSTWRDWEQGRKISGEPYLRISQLFAVSLSELFGAKEGDMAIQLKELQVGLEELLTCVKSLRAEL